MDGIGQRNNLTIPIFVSRHESIAIQRPHSQHRTSVKGLSVSHTVHASLIIILFTYFVPLSKRSEATIYAGITLLQLFFHAHILRHAPFEWVPSIFLFYYVDTRKILYNGMAFSQCMHVYESSWVLDSAKK